MQVFIFGKPLIFTKNIHFVHKINILISDYILFCMLPDLPDETAPIYLVSVTKKERVSRTCQAKVDTEKVSTFRLLMQFPALF